MVMSIYRKALRAYVKKPFKFWGITLLLGLVSFGLSVLFGIIPGVLVAVSYALAVGLTYIFLCGYNSEEVKASDLFVAFTDGKTAKRVIGGMAWKDLIIFLWTLIPVVGWIFAIIRSYSYALTPYILIKEPDIKATDAVKVSAARMKGYRGKMFGADLLATVIALLIALVAMMIVVVVNDKFPVIALVLAIIVAAYLLISIISLPLYMKLVRAGFYAEIMAKQNDAE